MPAFTFNPDGPATITHPDGTVSVNAPRPDATSGPPTAAPGGSATARQADDLSITAYPQEPRDPEPGVPSTVPAPSDGPEAAATSPTASDAGVPADEPAMSEPAPWGATPADDAASDSVVNPDGSITTRLPDGSTQTVVRLPGGATIVTRTTQPGDYSQPVAADRPRARRRRGGSR
jgi:hypothetical protein